jgi:GT2 family glycosyltransferase
MISVIFCSIDNSKAKFVERHYRELLKGQEFEIIAIRDARSLAEAFNRGIERASGDILIFSHDDIEFLNPKAWFARLTDHLNDADVVGVAGTTRLIGGAWAQVGPPYNFGRVAENDGQKAKYRVLIFSTPAPLVMGIQALDGCFIAVKRSVVQKLRFDEKTFDGFHCYDIDFTFSAYSMGFKVAVATDLAILHASSGNFDPGWQNYVNLLVAKHKKKLSTTPRRSWQAGMVWANTKQEVLEILES